MLRIASPVELLKVFTELNCAITPAQLYLECLEAADVRSKARQAAFAAAANAHKHCVATRLPQYARQATHMIHSVLEEHCRARW
jgi:hypothetical protein